MLGGGTCSASGNGDINDVVSVPVGATLSYVLSVTVLDDTFGLTAINEATVTAAVGTTDPNLANNTAQDSDLIDSDVPLPESIFSDGFEDPPLVKSADGEAWVLNKDWATN